MTITIANPTKHRWSIGEYYAMADAGLFRDRRVQLIDGEVLDMPPQGSAHFSSILLAAEAARRAFGKGFIVRTQGPLNVSEDCEPEPDIAVVPGDIRADSRNPHPTTALLIIEISDSSLSFDRNDKASLYASVGIADYWIVNLDEQQVEVYRQPVADETERFGFRYSKPLILKSGQSIKPLAAAGEIAAADLLP
jgi:Uma2 family endonuclease